MCFPWYVRLVRLVDTVGTVGTVGTVCWYAWTVPTVARNRTSAYQAYLTKRTNCTDRTVPSVQSVPTLPYQAYQVPSVPSVPSVAYPSYSWISSTYIEFSRNLHYASTSQLRTGIFPHFHGTNDMGVGIRRGSPASKRKRASSVEVTRSWPSCVNQMTNIQRLSPVYIYIYMSYQLVSWYQCQ